MAIGCCGVKPHRTEAGMNSCVLQATDMTSLCLLRLAGGGHQRSQRLRLETVGRG